MSISNRHSVVPFVAGETQAMADQRLAKVGYKSTKKTPAKYKSIAVSVPVITSIDEDQLERLLPHVVSMLENAQDGIIRSLYESSQGNLASVSDDEISIDACIGYLEAEATGGRLTKEKVEEWFTENLSDNLSVTIADKLNFTSLTGENEKVINQHLNAYKGILASLAGGKTLLNPAQIAGCKKALELASNEDDTYKKLMARLEAMEKKPDMDALLEL